MLRRQLIPVWVAIIILASMYLMGQGWGPVPSGPPAPVPKTGQTTSYATGDDGDLEKGVAWPDPRFTDNGDGTVTDNLTGLVWTKAADCASGIWQVSLDYCNAVADGTCGLSDASSAGDWRLANRFELESLLDMQNISPPLPTGHPFTAVNLGWYWSSTTFAESTSSTWIVNFYDGNVHYSAKSTFFHFAWCVRGGQ